MSTVAYQVKICDDDENIISIIDNASINYLEWVVAENEVGALTLRIPQRFVINEIQPYRQLILERDIGGGYEIVENRRWFVMDWAHYTDSNGADLTEIIAHDQLEILNGYVVAYPEDTSYSKKTDNYDDICKLVVTENIASPTDTTRAINSITVATGTGSTGSDTFEISYQNLLDICKRCANASWEEGVYLVFDLVNTGPGAFQMRTWTTQRGVDHTMDGDDPRLIVLTEGRVEARFSDSANVVIAGKPYKTADNPRWRGSRFSRREVYVSAQSDDEDAVQAEARAELMRRRPRVIITGKITETNGMRYGIDYRWGDLITAQYKTVSMDAHISAVGATYQEGAETLNISVKGERWI